jgi:endonuclease/exonuclease/phosphatase family metal-dependent hydrolase
MAFRHCCRAGGLAVLSKFPFEEKEYLDAPEGGWFPGWRLLVESPLGRLQVLNVHLRPQLSERGGLVSAAVSGYFSTPPIREAQITEYYAAIDPALPTLIVGDFNETSDGRAVKFLAGKGLRSALPEFKPGEPTWRWKTSLGPITSQLDHIAYNDRLEPLGVEVLARGNSDHLPVVATFQLK